MVDAELAGKASKAGKAGRERMAQVALHVDLLTGQLLVREPRGADQLHQVQLKARKMPQGRSLRLRSSARPPRTHVI